MVCGTEQELPYTCNYCGEALCSDHRLPKAHMCAGLRDAEQFDREQKFGEFADIVDPLDDEPQQGRVARAVSRVSKALGRD